MTNTSELLAIAVWQAGLMSNQSSPDGGDASGGEEEQQKTHLSESSSSLSSSCSSSSSSSSSSCRVCGAASASWHYGAVVCEACKKFYIRSQVEQRYMTYVCTAGTGTCRISVEARACQSCRLKKCMLVGMSMRRDEQPESVMLKVDSLIQHVKCVICSSKSSGIHFGVITCEACKVSCFFFLIYLIDF